MPQHQMRGRQVERDRLDRLIDDARNGLSGVLVVRGEPGTGKTTLLEHAVDAAPDLRVVRAQGVECEMDFAYSALHQLLVPFQSSFDRLPPPQRHSLETAFGVVPGPPPNGFLVGLAVITLLCDAANEQPVLCVVDDAHLIDHESAEVITFVARQLLVDRVAIVLGVGGGSGPSRFCALPEVRLQGLDNESSGQHRAAAPTGRDERLPDEAERSTDEARRPSGCAVRAHVRVSRVAPHVINAQPRGRARHPQVSTDCALGEGDGLVNFLNAAQALDPVDRRGARDSVLDTLEAKPNNDPGTRYAMIVVEMGFGRYEAAFGAARDLYEMDPVDFGTRVLPDLVEAATRTGQLLVASSALERLSSRALASGTPLALGILARSKALLADDDHAQELYQEAIDRLGTCRPAPELARAHLLYGEWLRRQRRRRDARTELRVAHDLFKSMGLDGFARRALGEFLATGERAKKRSIGRTEELTPQEAHVARLVTEGLTNREIAVRLFISPTTVDYHLRKVFRKAEVSSRSQLVRALLTARPASLPLADSRPIDHPTPFAFRMGSRPVGVAHRGSALRLAAGNAC